MPTKLPKTKKTKQMPMLTLAVLSLFSVLSMTAIVMQMMKNTSTEMGSQAYYVAEGSYPPKGREPWTLHAMEGEFDGPRCLNQGVFMRMWWGMLTKNSPFTFDLPICSTGLANGFAVQARRVSRGELYLTVTSPSGKIYNQPAPGRFNLTTDAVHKGMCFSPATVNADPGVWKVKVSVTRDTKDAYLYIFSAGQDFVTDWRADVDYCPVTY